VGKVNLIERRAGVGRDETVMGSDRGLAILDRLGTSKRESWPHLTRQQKKEMGNPYRGTKKDREGKGGKNGEGRRAGPNLTGGGMCFGKKNEEAMKAG